MFPHFARVLDPNSGNVGPPELKLSFLPFSGCLYLIEHFGVLFELQLLQEVVRGGPVAGQEVRHGQRHFRHVLKISHQFENSIKAGLQNGAQHLDITNLVRKIKAEKFSHKTF